MVLLSGLSEIRTFERFLFRFQTLLSVQSNLVPNDDPLSEIWTCSDFGRLLYVVQISDTFFENVSETEIQKFRF